MRSIASFLFNRRCESLDQALDGCFGKKYCGPGLWAALAVLSRARHRDPKEVLDMLEAGGHLDYGKAIGIEGALDCEDTFSWSRTNKGANYSPLVLLDREERTNEATHDIASCVRTWFGDSKLERFAAELCDVVGDLHDNVWSHAKSPGVSMAQKWSDGEGSSPTLEFALADSGYGLLGELVRSGVSKREGIDEAAAAIAWCIVRGHSSKIKDEDPWAQRLPEDVMGNPIGPAGKVMSNGNNHLGLGLAKLVELVTKFKGTLWLASGNAMLTIDPKGGTKYQNLPFSWPGVLLSCRFEVATVEEVANSEPETSDEIDELIGSLVAG